MRKIATLDTTLVQGFVNTQQQLPTHKPIVQYIRQSTTKQLKRNKQSYELQDSDLRRNLLEMGYQDTDESIIKIGTDQGKSGTKRRDERSGLDYLYELLENDRAGAVAAFDVSRLYRVLSRAEYGAFCDLVLERKIPVVTASRIYWPTRVDNDQLNDDFRAAAMFIEDIIKGKLIAAKNRHIQFDVSYGGHAIPFGFVVDDMGNETADKKFYRIYEPHAEMIRWLFRYFREIGGNLPPLARELKRMDFRFPPFEQGISPHVGLHPDEDGYYPLRNRAALVSILTNRAYIGYYEYGGRLVSTQAHDAIVPLDDFMYAYDRLSGTSLDGQERKPRERRYVGTNALLDGVVTCGDLPIYVMEDGYCARAGADGFTRNDLAVPVANLDGAFQQAMIAVLGTLELGHRRGVHQEIYHKVKALQKEQEKQVKGYTKALVRIDDEIDKAEMAQRVSKELGDEQGYRENTKQLVQLRKDRVEIEAKAKHANDEVQELKECHTLLECAIQQWDSMKMNQRKRFVKLFVSSANLTEASPHFLRLDVTFSEPINRAMTLYLYRTHGAKQAWTKEEDSTLLSLYPQAGKQALMEALPLRSWESIQQRAYYTHHIRRVDSSHGALTYADVLVMQEHGACVDKPTWIIHNELEYRNGMAYVECAVLEFHKLVQDS